MQLQQLKGIVSSDIYKQLSALENFDKTEEKYLHNLILIERDAIACNDYVAQAEINNRVAKYYFTLTDYKNAAINQKRAITLAKKIDNKELLSKYYSNLSGIAIRTSYLNKAVKHSFEGLKYKSTNETKVILYMNLGICFRKQKKLEKSLEYFKKALEISKENNLKLSYLNCNVANLYLDMRNFEKSYDYFNKTLDTFSDYESITVKVYALQGIGKISLFKGEKDEAISYFKIALRVAIEQKKFHNATDCNILIGSTYAKLNTFDDALSYLNAALALAQKHNYEEQSLAALRELQNVYYKKNDIEKAYQYLSLFIKAKDDFREKRETKELSVIIDEKETEIDLLKENNEKIIQQNEELKEYSFIVAHHLQEPLRNINGFCGLLEMKCGDQLSDLGKEYLSYLNEASKQVHLQLKGLLNYLEVDELGTLKTNVNIDEVVSRTIQVIKNSYPVKTINISYKNLPVIWAVKPQIHLLFYHILANAVKFSNQTVNILISCKQINKTYEFTIIDDGIGINENYQSKIFNIFNRVDKNDDNGIGVGLSICKKIVRNHGGSIQVSSNGVSGSTFKFTIKVN